MTSRLRIIADIEPEGSCMQFMGVALDRTAKIFLLRGVQAAKKGDRPFGNYGTATAIRLKQEVSRTNPALIKQLGTTVDNTMRQSAVRLLEEARRMLEQDPSLLERLEAEERDELTSADAAA